MTTADRVRVAPTPDLQLLRPDHAPAVLAFEVANRAFFARSISDRGEAYFANFDRRHALLLAEINAGAAAFYVLVDDGEILGRFNLIFGSDGTAELGYRVAESACGRGVATSAVRRLCAIAGPCHGVRTIRAATSNANVASQRVLAKAGFVAAGTADPSHIGGKTGRWYERQLRT